MKDMYLIPKYNGYRVVIINKTNTKSYTLSDGSRMDMKAFDEIAHKLTEEEKAIFKGELVVHLSGTASKISNLRNQLINLKVALNSSEFAVIDRERLQKEIDKFTEDLSKMIKPFKIDDKYYKFKYDYHCDLELATD